MIIDATVRGKLLTVTINVKQVQRDHKNNLARAWWSSNETGRAKALRRMRRYYWSNPERERARKRRYYARKRQDRRS